MMERTVLQYLAEYLANSLWQVPLLFVAAWLLLRIVRPGVQAQHRLWLAVLVLAVVLPLRGIHSHASALRETGVSPAQVLAGFPAHASQDNTAADSVLQPAPAQPRGHWLSRWLVWPVTFKVRNLPLRRNTIHWLLGLYAAWFAFGLVRLMRSWWSVRQRLCSAQELVLPERAAALLDECCAAFDVARPRVLLLSDAQPGAMQSPVLVGAFQPVLLLPSDVARLEHHELKAVLCHELAHLQRRDYLVNLLCLSASLPLGYHPAMAAIHRRLRQTREMVCDALAAQAMHSASGYARCLVVLATRMVERRETVEQLHAMGLFNKTILEERVMQLLEQESKRNLGIRMARAAAGVTILVLGTFAAAAFHLKPVVLAAQTISQPADPAIAASTAPAIVSSAIQTEPETAADPAAAQTSAPTTEPAPVQAAQPAPVSPIEQVQPSPRVQSAPPVENSPVLAPLQPEAALTVTPHPVVVLAPQDRARIDEQVRVSMRASADQLKLLMKQMHNINTVAMQKQIDKQMQYLNSPTFKKQMADVRQQMEVVQRQIAEANLHAAAYQQRMDAARKQLQQASQAIADTRKQIQNQQLQKQLDDAQKAIAAASKAFPQ